MALTKAQKEELDTFKAELRKEFAAQNAQAETQPQLPVTTELDLADVIRILIQHSRVPLESTQIAMLAAVDKAFSTDETEDDETVVDEEPVVL